MAKKPASQSSPKPNTSSSTTGSTKASTPAPLPASAVRTIPIPISSPSASPSKPQGQATTLTPRSSPQEIAVHVWNKYLTETPSRTLLLDVFMAFLVLVGGVQFVYCVLAGNFPFNAFLSGFSAAVGQFVLTASLRMQTSERPPAGSSSAAKRNTGTTGELLEDGKSVNVSSERAFADFVFGSLILHGFCVNFIN